jgi:heme o synthase
MIRAYYQLTKPGIIRGNVMTATGGFLLAANGHIAIGLYSAAMVGVTAIIASACVTNNYIDREIDKKMQRTQKRALATGEISVASALLFAAVLGVIGFVSLALFVNSLTLLLGVIAFVFYVGIYGYAKRRSPLGTLVGSVPGAMSVTAGYTAVTNRLDAGAALLFLIMVAWQMPHFYAIAIYRLKEYKAADLPVLPSVRGIRQTKNQIVLFMCLYVAAVCALFVAGYGGWTYLIVMLGVSGWWLLVAAKGLHTPKSDAWARKVFGVSLAVLTTFSVMISVNAWLP